MPTIFDLLFDLTASALQNAELDAASERRIRSAREERERSPNVPKRTSRYASEDPKDRSPAQLARGSFTALGHELDGGAWQLVVMMPSPHPEGVVMPRDGRSGLPGQQTGDGAFDRAFVLLEAPNGVVAMRAKVRDLWTSAACDWLYAGGTLTATLPRFDVRYRIFDTLDEGLDIAQAWVEAQTRTNESLLDAIGDSGWQVAAAALDALLESEDREAIVQAYERILGGQTRGRRLRVHALYRAGNWPALMAETRGADSSARSDAFQLLVEHGPRATAQEAAVELLTRRTGLDDARAAWVIDELSEGAAPLVEIISPELRERYLCEFLDEDGTLAESAADLLARLGTAGTVATLETLASRDHDDRARALAARIRARLGQGNLGLVDPDAAGGLALDE